MITGENMMSYKDYFKQREDLEISEKEFSFLDNLDIKN